MKIKILLVGIIFSTLLACSSAVKVQSTYDKKVDFSKYKTFNFYEIKEEHLKIQEVNRRRLAMAIEIELGMKGIKKSSNDPDLLVNLFSTLNRVENSTSQYNNGLGYYGAATPYGTAIGVSVSPGSLNEYYTKGSVTVDLVDRKENQLVLEGITTIDAGDREDADRIINYAVKKMFEDIPNAGSKK